ncbi:hypothetical protein N665_0431s0027 [Sinapis alba]|nr:hypothetical protein N665_0431s0027 [Sinapis alba]
MSSSIDLYRPFINLDVDDIDRSKSTPTVYKEEYHLLKLSHLKVSFLVVNIMSLAKKQERREKDNGDERSKGSSSTEIVRTVTEEEVDEFFKILRRVHVATRTAAKVNVGVDDERELPSKKRKRSQSLGLRDSLHGNGVRDEELDGITRVGLKNSGLDLNSKPEPETVSL